MPSPKAYLLPEEFISNMKTLPMMDKFTSIAFEPAFHATRLQLLDQKSPNFVDDFAIAPTANHPDAQIPRTYLQIASMIGDAPLLCEMIRAGGTVDIQDVKGNTALSLALGSLVSCQMALNANIPKPRSMSSQKLPASAERSTALLRLAYIVRVLIEQHADVNHQINGMSPLHLACQVRDWDLIALMLKHGANLSATSSNYPPSVLLSSSVDKSRFFALVQEFPAGNARPARMCPCFSGRPLFTCHEADALLYPPTMLCPCASGKSYGKCCIRRKMVMEEMWDEKSKRIMASSITPLSLPGLPKHQEDKVRRNVEGMMDAMEFLGFEEELGLPYKGLLNDKMQMKNAMEFKAGEADELLAKGLIDPAYAYALKIHDFWPRSDNLLPES